MRPGQERGERGQPPGRRGLGRMVLLAALLHLLLFLVPFEAGLDERPRLRTVALELTPVEPRPEPVPVPVPERLPEAETTESAREESPAPREPSPTARAPATPSEAPPVIAPEVPAPEPEAIVETRPGPSPELATEPSPSAAAEGAPIDLLPEPLFARLAGGDEPEEPLSEEGRIRHRVHTYVRELQGRDRVQVGLIDPYFRQLGENIRASFEPDWSVYDSRSGQEGIGGALRAWMQDYRETADRYALSGSPYRDGERDHALLRGGVGSPPDTTVSGARTLGGMGEMAALRDLWNDVVHGKAGGVELLALVRVSQAPDGALLRVEIETPSGRPAYDRLALRSVRTALTEPLRPPRMGEGLGLTGESIESLWAFRTRFTVTPPAWTIVPMAGIGGIGSAAGCDIGANGGVGKCFTPLSRQAFPHLELIAVY